MTTKVKKRPMWCGIAMAITAFGLYMMALPHFLTGTDWFSKNHTVKEQDYCGSAQHQNTLENKCADDGSRIVDWAGLVLVFLGIALTGVGSSLFWCFGMVYLDDNAGKENSPFMLRQPSNYSSDHCNDTCN